MAALTVNQIVRAGLDSSGIYAAASGGGDTVVPGRYTFLHVKNGGGGAITVTVDAVPTCDQGFDHDISVSVGASGEEMIGPIDARYQQTSGVANITYSGVTSVTIAAIKF